MASPAEGDALGDRLRPRRRIRRRARGTPGRARRRARQPGQTGAPDGRRCPRRDPRRDARARSSSPRRPTRPGSPGAISRDAATTVRLLLTLADAATAIKGDPGVSRRVAWKRPPVVEEIKQAAHRHDATVNDVLLAAVSGALRHYLQDHDSSVAEIQAMVPFNLLVLDEPVPRELGNKFASRSCPASGCHDRQLPAPAQVDRRMQDIKNGATAPRPTGC